MCTNIKCETIEILLDWIKRIFMYNNLQRKKMRKK